MIPITRVFILSCFFSGCACDKTINNFVVIKYEEVEKGYHYSNEMIEYKSKKYKPILASEYKNDTLSAAETFKSDGRLRYNKNDLYQDKQLKELLGIIERRTLVVNNDYLDDNHDRFQITERKGNIIYCIRGQELRIYSFN